MGFRWIGKAADESTVTLKNLNTLKITPPSYASKTWVQDNQNLIRFGAVLDVETTGLNQESDEIIELAVRQFIFNKETGEILASTKSYSSFSDPGFPIPPEIQNITGINDEMVQGQSINWEDVDTLLNECQIIIAHNARFDRPFIDKKSKVSPDKAWACSLKQIDWAAKGFTSSKLELLNIYHGFFTGSHRAINDVDALIYLVSLPDDQNKTPYLLELITNARRLTTQVVAIGAPFESKDLLKVRGYQWDNVNRYWNKIIFKDDVNSEQQWLEENAYHGPFRGLCRDIPLTDAFKAQN